MSESYHLSVDRQCMLFSERLPKKPYACNDLAYGLSIVSKSHAIKRRYIQPNGPTHKYCLVFDIDRAGGGIDWHERGAPEPTLSVINPENGHAHLIYFLEVSVRTASDARGAPLRFAAAVECGLRALLDADAAYSGLITKNPLHEHWRTLASARQPYDLAELGEWVDLNAYSDRRRKLPDYGLGRNCTLFDRLRLWSYKAIRQGYPSYNQWITAVEQRSEGLNLQFDSPLESNECRHIARSVAKWTYKNFSAAAFSEYQAAQGSKGGKAKGLAYAEKSATARLLAEQGMTQQAIAEQLGVSQMSVSRWLK